MHSMFYVHGVEHVLSNYNVLWACHIDSMKKNINLLASLTKMPTIHHLLNTKIRWQQGIKHCIVSFQRRTKWTWSWHVWSTLSGTNIHSLRTQSDHKLKLWGKIFACSSSKMPTCILYLYLLCYPKSYFTNINLNKLMCILVKTITHFVSLK